MDKQRQKKNKVPILTKKEFHQILKKAAQPVKKPESDSGQS